jgi:putative N-acetyltransferase (TIGR04045 family)
VFPPGFPRTTPHRPVRPSRPVTALVGIDPVLCRPASDAASRAAHHAIRHAVFVEEQGVFTLSDLDAHDARDDVIHVLALYDGCPAGTVRLHPTGPGEWLGDRLAVLPEFRSASIGGPLVRFAVATASARGGRVMHANVQVANERFFHRLGWSTAGEVETYVGHPHVPMSIALSPVCTWLTGPEPASA